MYTHKDCTGKENKFNKMKDTKSVLINLESCFASFTLSGAEGPVLFPVTDVTD